MVPSLGGPIRFVAPGDFFFPTQMRFSPDDKQIVCMIALQLYVIDIATGAMTHLPIPEDGALSADWSPDGRCIVYASSGIRLFDLATGESRLIPGDPSLGLDGYGGGWPLWSRDGTQIAFVHMLAHESRVAVVNPDGTGYRALAATDARHCWPGVSPDHRSRGRCLLREPRWLHPPSIPLPVSRASGVLPRWGVGGETGDRSG
jgi:WD40 repeat protein